MAVLVTRTTYDMSQELIQEWKQICNSKSIEHKRKAVIFRRKHLVIGSIPIVLPILLGVTNSLLLDNMARLYISTIGFAAVTLASGVYRFLDLGSRTTEHSTSDYLYQNLTLYIDMQLSRVKGKQAALDLLTEHVNTEMKSLDLFSPSLNHETCCHRR